jgi:hypothetical protein
MRNSAIKKIIRLAADVKLEKQNFVTFVNPIASNILNQTNLSSYKIPEVYPIEANVQEPHCQRTKCSVLLLLTRDLLMRILFKNIERHRLFNGF